MIASSSFAEPTLAAPAAPVECSAAQISFNTDDENGYFNGMSHSGTLLVLRNLGPGACSLAAQPTIGFEDAAHDRLPISRQEEPGMHPGPVVLPITVQAGAEVTSELRWVSSDAYDAHNAISPSFVTLAIGGQVLRHPFTGSLYGPAGKSPTYSTTAFKRDPQ